MKMIRIPAGHCVPALIATLMTCSSMLRAEGLSPDDQAFFDKHSAQVVQLQPSRVDDASFVKVFSTPFFHVKVVIKMGDGDESVDVVVARLDDKLVSVSRPSSDADMPDFPKMLNASFKLNNDDAAKDMQKALDVVYPIVGSDDDKKAEAFTHTGNQWSFVRGKFFDKHMGFVFETDASGTIKSAKYSLKLP